MRRAGLLITGVILATGAGLTLSSPAASAAGTSAGSTATTVGSQRHNWDCDNRWGRWNDDCDDWGNGWGNRWHHRRHHHRWHLWDHNGRGPWTDVRG